jgi:DegV family protein with EDD domain
MKILTDSAADLTPQDISELGIQIAPLYINFQDEQLSASDITPDDFYDKLRAIYPNVPTTAMPGAGEFASFYQDVAGEGDLLSLHISGGLSGTVEAARLGAEQSEQDVTVVDTMTLSGGQRFQVLAAANSALKGLSIESILEHLREIRAATEVIYTLETLEYLERGGRIGRVQALAGSLLKIKPVIKVAKEDGKYSTVGSGRTLKKALDMIVNYLEQAYDAGTPLWVSVMHGQFAEQAEVLGGLIRDKLVVDKLEILRISPVLGVHTGPGIVGVAVVPMHLMEG